MAQNVVGDFESFQEAAVTAGTGSNNKAAFRRVVELGGGVSLTASISGPVVVTNIVQALPAGGNLIGAVSVRGTPDVNSIPVASATASVVATSIGIVAAVPGGAGVNTARLSLSMYNAGTAGVTMFVRPGSTSAQPSDYAWPVVAGQTWEMPSGVRYTGAFSVFFSGATGNVRVTEYT